MDTTKIGREAEQRVADYLQSQGYALIEQNWRTRWCEIDLIMKKAKTVYFIEVKYRKTDQYGSGLDYITPKKLQQMKFAAELWLNSNDWQGGATLAGVEVQPNDQMIELVLY